MTHVLRGTVEAIVAVALVAIAVYLWRRQRRLTIERGELIERERLARQALEQAHRDIETLLNTVSHDLKGPLFTFTGYLDLLRLEAAEGLGELAALPVPTPGARPAWHLYVVRHERPDELSAALAAVGVGSRGYYRRPIHRQSWSWWRNTPTRTCGISPVVA